MDFFSYQAVIWDRAYNSLYHGQALVHLWPSAFQAIMLPLASLYDFFLPISKDVLVSIPS